WASSSSPPPPPAPLWGCATPSCSPPPPASGSRRGCAAGPRAGRWGTPSPRRSTPSGCCGPCAWPARGRWPRWGCAPTPCCSTATTTGSPGPSRRPPAPRCPARSAPRRRWRRGSRPTCAAPRSPPPACSPRWPATGSWSSAPPPTRSTGGTATRATARPSTWPPSPSTGPALSTGSAGGCRGAGPPRSRCCPASRRPTRPGRGAGWSSTCASPRARRCMMGPD
ncbi:MAG: Ribonuclease HII, partial [uncultured Quadrisphaera sp.]